MFDLTGKGALVTGATGGIGGAIAKALHAQGANVAISGTKAERLEALASELGSRVFVLPCDLRDRPAVAQRVSQDQQGAVRHGHRRRVNKHPEAPGRGRVDLGNHPSTRGFTYFSDATP